MRTSHKKSRVRIAAPAASPFPCCGNGSQPPPELKEPEPWLEPRGFFFLFDESWGVRDPWERAVLLARRVGGRRSAAGSAVVQKVVAAVQRSHGWSPRSAAAAPRA